MKKKFLFLMFAFLLAVPAFAQKQSKEDRESRRQEMLEIKLDFLASEIGLKDSQRKQFDDLYTQMEAERRAIYKKIKNAEKSVKDNKNASEADYDKATKEINASKAEMSQVEKQYDEKFSTFLSKKQMFKLKEAEGKFSQKMQGCRDKKKHEKNKK